MADDLDETERLLNKVPRWKCPKCGITDPKRFMLFHPGTFEATVREVNDADRRIFIEDGESQWHMDIGARTRIICMECNERFELPADWGWE